MSVKIVDLLNWISSPIPFLLNLSFVFFAYFIRAYLRRASFGARPNGTWTGHSPGNGMG